MKKRGQFYLIAAIIIIMVILSLSTVSNYLITKKTPVKFYDLSKELVEEGARVADYGVYSGGDVSSIIEDFLDDFANYSSEKEKETELIFVFGNKSNMSIITYSSEETGDITIYPGSGEPFTVKGDEELAKKVETFTSVAGDEIKVEINGNIYEFTLRQGENFYFILTKESGDETHVTTPEQPGEGLNETGLPTGPK